MSPHETWNEERVLRWLARALRPRGLSASYGSDAAVLRAVSGRDVVCADQTVLGVHCELDTPARLVGRKACARALSDLAATAATPRAVLLALCLPRETEERWIRAAIRGVQARARDFGAELVGGDLALAPGPARLAVTALGSFPARGRPPGRDRARPGQIVVATGSFGGSALGRHLRLEPRFAAGRRLVELGATAMMDVSDGLALDLGRLARASAVRIDLERVPIHADARRAARGDGRSARDHALTDGEDHELVATLPASAWERARTGPAGAGLLQVGRVARGEGLRVAGDDGVLRAWRGVGGWVHGAS